jgi:cytochrome c peroxidase
LPLSEAVARLQHLPEYADAFLSAFGRTVNSGDLARALASYARSIVAGDSPVDRYMAGDRTALSDEAQQGLALFQGRANCSACHVGPILSDEQFHDTGVAWKDGILIDVGRFAHTGTDADRGAFKTPTLREIARTAPYMHDGSLATLDNVIEFYERGGNSNPHLDPEVRPLGLTGDEKHALVAFLRSLNGTIREGPDPVVSRP